MSRFYGSLCSNNSAADCDISSKFGLQIEFDLLKQVSSLNPTGSGFATPWPPSSKIDMDLIIGSNFSTVIALCMCCATFYSV